MDFRSARITFSQILTICSNAGYVPIDNATIEFDGDFYVPSGAITFNNCILESSKTQIAMPLIRASEGFRFENCIFRTNICFWGEDSPRAGYAPLERKGPNFFVDQCRAETYEVSLYENQPPIQIRPKIQISGFIDHARVTSTPEHPFEVTVSACRFSRLDLLGRFTAIQLTEYSGSNLSFSDVSFDFIWIREKLLASVIQTEIDRKTIQNMSTWLKKLNHQIPNLLDTIKMFLELLATKKEGSKFIMLNEAYSKVAPSYAEGLIEKIKASIIYSVFKNFYSISPWLIIGGVVVIFFALIAQLVACENFADSLHKSLFSFSGNPDFEKGPPYLPNVLGAIEAFVGIFFVVAISIVIGRRYSNYV